MKALRKMLMKLTPDAVEDGLLGRTLPTRAKLRTENNEEPVIDPVNFSHFLLLS